MKLSASVSPYAIVDTSFTINVIDGCTTTSITTMPITSLQSYDILSGS